MSDTKRSEDILADLYARREEAKSGGLGLRQLQYMNQQIVAHETLIRLVGERDEMVKEKRNTMAFDAQIKFWRAMADMTAMTSPELAPDEDSEPSLEVGADPIPVSEEEVQARKVKRH